MKEGCVCVWKLDFILTSQIAEGFISFFHRLSLLQNSPPTFFNQLFLAERTYLLFSSSL